MRFLTTTILAITFIVPAKAQNFFTQLPGTSVMLSDTTDVSLTSGVSQYSVSDLTEFDGRILSFQMMGSMGYSQVDWFRWRVGLRATSNTRNKHEFRKFMNAYLYYDSIAPSQNYDYDTLTVHWFPTGDTITIGGQALRISMPFSFVFDMDRWGMLDIAISPSVGKIDEGRMSYDGISGVLFWEAFGLDILAFYQQTNWFYDNFRFANGENFRFSQLSYGPSLATSSRYVFLSSEEDHTYHVVPGGSLIGGQLGYSFSVGRTLLRPYLGNINRDFYGGIEFGMNKFRVSAEYNTWTGIFSTLYQLQKYPDWNFNLGLAAHPGFLNDDPYIRLSAGFAYTLPSSVATMPEAS